MPLGHSGPLCGPGGPLSGPGIVAAAGGVTGTGDLTVPVVTLAGAGVLKHVGAGDLTIPAVTLAGTAVKSGIQTGTGALTIGQVTLSGTGVIKHIGTGSLVIAGIELSGTGTGPASADNSGSPWWARKPYKRRHDEQDEPQTIEEAITRIEPGKYPSVEEAAQRAAAKYAQSQLSAEQAAVEARLAFQQELEQEKLPYERIYLTLIAQRIEIMREEDDLLLLLMAA